MMRNAASRPAFRNFSCHTPQSLETRSNAALPATGYRVHQIKLRGEVVVRGTEDESSRLLEEDLQRYSKKSVNGDLRQPDKLEAVEKPGGGAKDLLDKVLIGDFFFVLLALAWLAVGVVEKSTLKSSQLLDVWFPLWTLVFQPAIGVLMLGALVSGGLGWLQSQQE